MVYDFNEQPIVRSLYVARRLDLPPLTALAAFNAHRDAACADESAKPYLVETPGAKLRFIGSCAPERSWPSAALRRALGRLHHGRTLVSFPVEIEVSRWSATRCEIGIRPRGRTVPMTDSWLQRRYIALSEDAAKGLARALESRVEDGIRAQLRDPDSRTTLEPA
jgi:hypothetical protein